MNKYRSGLEREVGKILGPTWKYEPCAYPYTSDVRGGECVNCGSKLVRKNRKYTPDFVKGDIWVECKGFFRATTTTKYKDIRKYYPNKKLVFLFSDPNKKVRKGGKATMAEFADKNGWKHCTKHNVLEILNEL